MSQPKRTIRFVAKEDSKTYYGEPVQSGDIGLLYHAKSLLTAHVLTSSPIVPGCRVTSTLRTVERLLAPLDRNEIKTIRGMGAQYGKKGAKKPEIEVPVLFYKPTTAICGPEDPIIIPESARDANNDYEVELCAVLGKEALNVSVEDALSYVGWYCTSNDVSSRTNCAKGVQWGFGKSYDSWCPIGPCLVSPSQVPDPQNLTIKTTVNGITRQLNNTSEMVLSLAELISRMSKGTTMEVGSIILTGSCLPLNRWSDPDPWLKHGDDVRVEVEGLGTLINPVVEEGGPRVKAKL
ncbi:hypothetical protein P7C70_g1780, partial [Phenoliferia sp. Uapishka_3]